MNEYRFPSCPFCKSAASTLVGILNYGPIAQFVDSKIELTRKPELWRCINCKSRFVQNVLAPHQAAKLYRQGSADKRWSQVEFRAERPREVISYLEQFFRPDMRILDIGCNTGEFLDFAGEMGCRTAGVEPSVSSRVVLAEKRHVSFPDIEDIEGRFDLITLFDTVEHLYAPREFFKIASKFLDSQGHVAILTGNPLSLPAKLAGSRWWYANHPEHIAFPSLKALEMMPNFRIQDVKRTFAKEGYRQPLQKSYPTAINRIRTRQYNGLPAITGDHFFVIFRQQS